MNLDNNTRITLMEDCVNMLNEMVDQVLTLPFSSEHVLERWSKKYLRSQRPLPELGSVSTLSVQCDEYEHGIELMSSGTSSSCCSEEAEYRIIWK